MKQLNQEEINSLDTLNNKLKNMEEKIYRVVLQENQKALEKIEKKEHNIIGYEIEVEFFIYENSESEEKLLVHWKENLKSLFVKEDKWGLNDNRCHNTTSIFQKNELLNRQKHCYLLHNLYDHYSLNWDDIFKIDRIYFDLQIQYEYLINITV